MSLLEVEDDLVWKSEIEKNFSVCECQHFTHNNKITTTMKIEGNEKKIIKEKSQRTRQSIFARELDFPNEKNKVSKLTKLKKYRRGEK